MESYLNVGSVANARSFCSETSLDDVLQISNVFMNVSKGEVAKSNDLQKAFGTSTVDDVVKEVSLFQ
jgi:ribosome maturation protein Sdo1